MKQTGVLQIASRSKYFSTDLLVRRKPADQSQQNKNGTYRSSVFEQRQRIDLRREISTEKSP
jgi:hypothetical protein